MELIGLVTCKVLQVLRGRAAMLGRDSSITRLSVLPAVNLVRTAHVVCGCLAQSPGTSWLLRPISADHTYNYTSGSSYHVHSRRQGHPTRGRHHSLQGKLDHDWKTRQLRLAIWRSYHMRLHMGVKALLTWVPCDFLVLKCTLRISVVKLPNLSRRAKAEIDFDGKAITQRYLSTVGVETIFEEARTVRDTKEMEEFMVKVQIAQQMS